MSRAVRCYDGLLVKLQKRMSKHYQATVSYAYQKELNMAAINLDNLYQGYGQNLAHHNLNIAGVGELPWGLRLSINSSMISRTPNHAYRFRCRPERFGQHNLPHH